MIQVRFENVLEHPMKIGFIGPGNLGGKLAGSLLRNGFDLIVRDLDQESAVALLSSGAEVIPKTRA